MADVTIEIRQNGPYRIHGEVNIIDHEGNPVIIPARKPGKPWISLCRCGASVTKPFCDGTHSRIGFKGAGEARAEFDATRPLP
jgi:3-phenylpropionate/trans-cinnamate dioxygenase ferredoxin subunit